MNIQMAPMEGLTTYIYRNAHAKCFGKMDKYYTPFLSLHKEKEFNHKERQEILAENNEGLQVIPQVLTNSSEDFLRAAKKLQDLGYREININFGCPSGTVTTKEKGAGILANPDRLQKFLEEVFEKADVNISIKTRIGMESPDEWEKLLDIYNQYPIKELIIHARVRQDFYKNKPHLEAYEYARKYSKNPICYNGDIFSLLDYQNLRNQFSDLDNLMLGRGVLSRPDLANDIYKYAGKANVKEITAKTMRNFHDEIFNGYQEIMSGDQNVLFKMKELWTYMISMYPEAEKQQKMIRKAKKCVEYLRAVDEILG